MLRILINSVFLVVYVALVPTIGFFTATGAYLVAHMYYLGVRPAYVIALATAGALSFFYVVFGHLLQVFIPHGILY